MIEHVGKFCLDTVCRIVDSGIVLVPTFIAAFDTVTNPVGAQTDGLFDDASFSTFIDWYKAECEILPKLWESGALLATGTDSGFPGTTCDSLFREMMGWRMIGIPMKDVLMAATEGAALAVGKEKVLGKLEEGYAADFIVLPSDPLKEPSVLAQPIEVWIEGERVH
ncbi:MAG: amidohydrolase family protein [bacterium]|nr:amidohydrolase family protein [bacterium]